MDDRKIIALFFERNEQAVKELSEKYGAVFTKVAYNILNNRQDAEECINDAYLAAWNTIPPHNPNPLLSYVCRIVRNLAIKKYHANTAAKRNSIYDAELDELENCFPSSESAEDKLNAAETARIIDGFLETLDKQSRIMFVRRYCKHNPPIKSGNLWKATGEAVTDGRLISDFYNEITSLSAYSFDDYHGLVFADELAELEGTGGDIGPEAYTRVADDQQDIAV